MIIEMKVKIGKRQFLLRTTSNLNFLFEVRYMFRVMIQVGLSSMVLLFSTVVAWYEGSNILQDSREWKYTAILSQWLNGGVANQSDILLPDYYIYAAKFFPTFPILMLLSATHLVILIGYIMFKRNQKGFAGFLSFIGITFFRNQWISRKFSRLWTPNFFQPIFLYRAPLDRFSAGECFS